MTREHVKQMLPILTAYAEGKEIQYKNTKLSPTWRTLNRDMEESFYTFKNEPECYRIKPTPTFRPWKPEEVPVGTIIRMKFDQRDIPARHLLCSFDSLALIHSQGNYSLEGLLKSCEHSLDNGKTWLPCGVLVEGEEV